MLRRLTLAMVVAMLAAPLGAVANEPPAERAGGEKPPSRKSAAVEPVAAQGVLAHELKDNVRLRLAGARFSEGRAHNLIAKFETLGNQPTARIVYFPPGSFTIQEQTLRAVVMACVDMSGGTDGDGWHAVQADAIFSLPKEDPRESGRYHQLEKCFLVSLKLKKE